MGGSERQWWGVGWMSYTDRMQATRGDLLLLSQWVWWTLDTLGQRSTYLFPLHSILWFQKLLPYSHMACFLTQFRFLLKMGRKKKLLLKKKLVEKINWLKKKVALLSRFLENKEKGFKSLLFSNFKLLLFLLLHTHHSLHSMHL